MAGSRETQDEYNRRVKECYIRRFESNDKFGVKEWLEYCSKEYPDKSQQQHTKMWADAGKQYEDNWKERLNKLLGPAVDKILENLEHTDPKIRDLAIKNIFKYSGYDITKSEIKGTIETIQVGFGKKEE